MPASRLSIAALVLVAGLLGVRIGGEVAVSWPDRSGAATMNGEVIGINTAGLQGAAGLGFAVSITTVRAIVPQLMTAGRVTGPSLGVSVTRMPHSGRSPDHGR